ncbi:hypothetical protein B0A50_06601 [Salinomyces thailandicus]|uniref:Uncharacterized protein n=1 Tax=Salinomyces thailandicus TaxID=706561 RepID=A0A4U0TSI7_9PEZI|nr:hypothetical protein B0A50_06601 [Salinomyces thailandica]
MSFSQEFSSWFAPKGPPIAQVPVPGTPAPKTPKLTLRPQTPTILAFLRHCGCPFAEKTFLNLRETAQSHQNLDFLAISHSSPQATETWLKSLPQAGSEPSNLRVIVDEELEAYAAWGLGTAGFAHVLSPAGLYGVWALGKAEGIWNRPTESGSRWQVSGAFGVDGEGIVRWGGAAGRADERFDFEEGVRVVESGVGAAKL